MPPSPGPSDESSPPCPGVSPPLTGLLAGFSSLMSSSSTAAPVWSTFCHCTSRSKRSLNFGLTVQPRREGAAGGDVSIFRHLDISISRLTVSSFNRLNEETVKRGNGRAAWWHLSERLGVVFVILQMNKKLQKAQELWQHRDFTRR